MTINTKIQPLVEDLGRIVPGEFLVSTVFKRWLIEHRLDKLWSQCLSYVKDNRNYLLLGFDHDSSDADDALRCVVNILYEQENKKLLPFLISLLSYYATEMSVYIDVSNIRKDLLVAGYSESDISELDNITMPKHLEKKIKEEQTQEQIIRSLEQDYLALSDENSKESIEAYLKWHSETLLYLSNYYTEANADYSLLKHLNNSGNGYTLRRNFKSIYSIYNLLMNGITKQEIVKTISNGKKTPLVFISHSHDDEEFVVSLVNLLEDIGFTKENLFCSSVREYGIPLSGDIFDTIRGLFLDHDIYVIFVHSPRFYNSFVSLNEMGAAWVLKTDFCSFLTNDMSFDEMKGVVNNAKLSIKVDDKEAPSLLNDLYKKLITIFSLEEMDMSKWERKRDQFLSFVRNLRYKKVEISVQENDVDLEYKRLQIEKMKAEAEERKKGIIRGNIVKDYKAGSRILKIFNAGLAQARNVRVKWMNETDTIRVRGDFSDLGDLTPQNSRSYYMLLAVGHPDKMVLRFSWDDDYKVNNETEESLQVM